MSVRRREVGGVTVLYVGGEYYGGDETDALRKTILDQAAAGNTRLILNLWECGMMNSNALAVVVEAHRNYASRGGEIILCGAERRMKSLLVVSRLYDLFRHYETEAEAVAAFTESPAGA